MPLNISYLFRLHLNSSELRFLSFGLIEAMDYTLHAKKEVLFYTISRIKLLCNTAP